MPSHSPRLASKKSSRASAAALQVAAAVSGRGGGAKGRYQGKAQQRDLAALADYDALNANRDDSLPPGAAPPRATAQAPPARPHYWVWPKAAVSYTVPDRFFGFC